MHFSFKNIDWDHGIAHNGSRKIFFKRVAEKSDVLAFNFLDLVIVPKNADIGIHRHAADNQEVYIIISGCGQMTVEGQEIEVYPGSVVVNPIGGSHSLRNSGETDIYLVVVEMPVGVNTNAKID